MSKSCFKCNHTNPDTAHYCTECGSPLEKEGFSWRRTEKRYIVVSKSEYDNNKSEIQRLRNENNSLKNNWWYKFCQWFKKIGWDDVWGGVCFVGCILVPVIIFCIVIWGSCSNDMDENIQIKLNKENGKYALYNKQDDKLLTQYIYDTIEHRKDTSRNFFYLYKNGLCGIADSNGLIKIDCTLDSARGRYFKNDNIIITYSAGRQGVYDLSSARVIIPCNNYRVLWDRVPGNSYPIQSRYIGTYVGNIIPVRPTSGYGKPWVLYNREGKRINNQYYKEVRQTGLPDLVIVVSEYGKEGLVNQNGTTVLTPSFYQIYSFSEGMTPNVAWAQGKSLKTHLCLDEKGRTIFTLPVGYKPHSFHEGLAAIEYNGKIGYCDNTGRYVIPIRYGLYNNHSPEFINGKAYVSYNGKNGTIDKNGVFTPEK